MISLILVRITCVVVHIIFLFSIFILFKGHNEPGGGFIGGLMSAVAVVLVYVAFGIQTVKQIIPVPYSLFIATGLLFAAGTGLGAVLLGYPFLTQTFDYVHLPLIGEIELATALLFDIGVYLTVVGATLLIISTMGKEE